MSSKLEFLGEIQSCCTVVLGSRENSREGT